MAGIKRWFYNLFKNKVNKDQKIDILNEAIDFDNLMSSAFYAKGLYDELKIVCHPDRFHTENSISKATELFQLVTQHKSDYNMLCQLKERIYKELPIK